jgi:capsular polysaccharide biosynthesis protein
MDQIEKYEEVNLTEYLEILWKRKWLIIIPTAIIIIATGIVSFLVTPVWEVDAIVLPSKFLSQTEQGQFNEVLVVDPKQVAGQINQDSYNNLLAAELNLDIRKFPKIRAENLRDTKLVRISVRTRDIDQGRKILTSLFNHLKGDFDKKIDVEIANNLSEIKVLEIQKDIIKQEVLSEENKVKISEDRTRSIAQELKSVKTRVDEIDAELKKALEEKRQGMDAVAILLYTNEVQNNLRYYNTLEEKLSAERLTQENLRLSIKGKAEALKQQDSKIELLKEKKQRIDYAQLVKEPTPSLDPVAPKRTRNVLLAAVLGAAAFILLAFFFEALDKAKNRTNRMP